MPKPAREPFADLSEDFRNQVDAADRDGIRKLIAEAAIAQAELMEAQKDDEDYQSAKEAAREAGAVYREGTKANTLKIKYARQALEGKGG